MIYLDETWANAQDSLESIWIDDDIRAIGGTTGGIHKPSSKSGRLYAGRENVWIDGAALVFQSKKVTGDYYGTK